jgi:4-diphosphocytidyl-2-C-methyl-D-erythritol kinase
MTTTAVSLNAHAKINLSLRIIGRRADGFHELKTVFQALDLHDTLGCALRPGPFVLRCPIAGVPLDDRNLIWRAAAALWRVAGREGAPRGVVVSLIKRIPLQAGLGGGSSDAAAALVALARLWKVRLTTLEMDGLARGLGADVPFFLYGGAALGLGRGDDIYPLVDLPPLDIVLVLPAFGVSTTDAFRWHDESGGEGGAPSPLPVRGCAPAVSLVVNDLEQAVLGRHPEIAGAKRALVDAGARVAAMSGSGSAVFGVFTDARTASVAERRVGKAGWRAIRTRTRPRGVGIRRRPTVVS